MYACLVMLVAVGSPVQVLDESGRESQETRFYTACRAQLAGEEEPVLVVGGFTDTGHGDLSSVSLYSLSGSAAQLRWRTLWKGDQRSSIRTLRAADLDGDGQEEIVVLGRVGREEVDARGQLKVLKVHKGVLSALDAATWQSGRYTHGYGMEIGDLDGDGLAEIATGGFYFDGGREQAELRIWSLEQGQLRLRDRAAWGGKGNTRVNAVAIGDLDDDARAEIVTAGRTGQLKDANEVTLEEQGQLTAWRFDRGRLRQLAAYQWEKQGPTRLREVGLADIDADARLEVVAAGRYGEQGRPYLCLFRLTGGGFETLTEVPWELGSSGELRDIAFHGREQGFRMVTVGSRGRRGSRQAELRVWKLNEGKPVVVQEWLSAQGDETRPRQVVFWPEARKGTRLLSVGFVERAGRYQGQILMWGEIR